MKRPALAAAVIYAVLAILMFAPGLLPGRALTSADTLWFDPPWAASRPAGLTEPSNEDLGDGPQYLQPYLRAAARRMPDVPLWNPNIVGGRPFHASPQSALFGPFTWPAYLLPFWTAVGLIAVLKLWVGAFGMYLLGRALGMRFGGALLAGVVFALSLRMVTWSMYPHVAVWAFFPWLMLCADRLVRKPDLLAGAALAAVVGLQFLAGHPESSLHALLLTAAFFAFRLWEARRDGAPEARRLRRPLLAFGAALAGGVALAAVSLVPVTELLLRSADFVDRRGAGVGDALPFKYAIGLFMPDWWGRPTQTPLLPLMLERAMYVGALPLMLALAALILRPTRTRIGVALFGGFWLAVVLSVPPFVQVVTRLPVLSSGHNTRLILFPIVALALLAGWGLDDVAARAGPAARRRLALGAAVALAAIPLLIAVVLEPSALKAPWGGFKIAWGFADPPGGIGQPLGQDVIRAAALIIWLTLAGAGLLLVAGRLNRRLGATAFVVLAVLLVCVDLFRAGMGQNPAIDRDLADPPATGAIRYLERQGTARFVSTGEFPHNVIPFDFDLYEARGYDLPILRRFDRLWRREVTPRSGSVADSFLEIPLVLGELTPRSLRTLRLLGVTHVLAPKTPALGVAGLRVVYDGPDARVYRLVGARPRVFVAPAQRVVGGDGEALDAITRPGFDPGRVAVTEERLAGVPGEGVSGGGSARIVGYEPERVVVRASSSGEGVLVLSDNAFPGWKATVDGREVPVERVDYLFRGVRVGPGAHTVVFSYKPLSWTIGWIVSLLALTTLTAAAAIGWSRRKRGLG